MQEWHNMRPLLAGEELYNLIPQRPPIVMVDAFYGATEDEADTSLTIAQDNIFCQDGRLCEPGIVEHVAQSAAAFAGFDCYNKGEKPKLGFIGEIKKFRIDVLPPAGSTIFTHLKILGSAMGMSLLSAEVSLGSEVIASGQMKIFIKE